ncbi:MAG: carboxypeptidase-like regulatory domain-containing protein [Pyrinomonadaceae bacterium]
MKSLLWQRLRASSHAKIEGRIIAFTFALLVSTIFAASVASAHGKSTLRVRVVYEDTGRPLSRTEVSVFELNGAGARHQATTDERGEFSLKNMIAGTYGIGVNAPGLVNPWLNSYERETDARTVSVDGINPVEVVVRVRRGGVIAGRILRASGEPAAGAIVSILKEWDGHIRPFRVIDAGRTQIRTDARGLYRIASLSSGKYFVSAAEDSRRTVEQKGAAGGSDRAGFGALRGTFYQATTSLRDALPVQVEAGSESDNINITLIERNTHIVAGKVVGSDGRAVGPASIMIQNRDESGRLNTGRQSTMVDAQGNWSFDAVPDGAYLLTFSPALATAPYAEDKKDHQASKKSESPPNFTLKRQALTVAGADVTGIVVEVYRGVRISGTVTVEGGGPPPSAVNVYNLSEMFVPARVAPDGTFKLDEIPPGNVYLDAYPETEGEYYTKSMTSNGVDLMREPLRAEEGAEIKDVRIIISPEVATLKGRVFATTQGRAPLVGVSVVLVPTDPSRQRIPTSRIYTRTNEEGAFKLSGAPGEYMALIWKRGDPQLNEEFIKARAATAPRVTLGPGLSKSLDITMPEAK